LNITKMPIPLATENIWFNKAACDDAERLYYEKLAGAKEAVEVKKAEEDDDVDLFESDGEEEPQEKFVPKPIEKAKPIEKEPSPVKSAPKKETIPKAAAATTAAVAATAVTPPAATTAVPDKVWTNKTECNDAEKKHHEKLAQPGSYRNPANGERTFIMLKPDAVHRGLVGVIMDRFESRGFKLLACKFMKASQDLLKEHYADLSKKGFFSELIRYMSSGPLVPMVWEGLNAVKQGRMMLGATNPKDSDPGTIRGDFCVDVGRNLIHGSDSLEAAEKEIKLWFRPEEVEAWRSATVEWVYEEEEEEEVTAASEPEKGAGDAPKGLSAQIAKARQHIKNSLECVDGLVALAGGEETNLVNKLNALEIENKQLKKVTDDLSALVLKLEARVAVLEKGSPAPVETPKAAPVQPAPAKPAEEEEDDDEDVDLFGSDDDEEDDAEKARVTAERLKAYHEKKAKKPALIAKTSVLFDVKPWDDETDMNEMLKSCKSIEMEGLVWGASKLVPVGYGINKLQVMCVVEDDKVSIEELSEKMAEFEDFVQSVDVAAMSKI